MSKTIWTMTSAPQNVDIIHTKNIRFPVPEGVGGVSAGSGSGHAVLASVLLSVPGHKSLQRFQLLVPIGFLGHPVFGCLQVSLYVLMLLFGEVP